MGTASGRLQSANPRSRGWEKAAQREQQEDQLDSQEDTLERDYRSGTISREELVEKLAELERQKMELDALEDALERLGIDD